MALKRLRLDSQKPPHSLPLTLIIKQSSIPGDVLGVWSQELIPKGTRFGPYQNSSNFEQRPQKNCCQRRMTKKTKSSLIWLEYINSTCNEAKHNLISFEYQGEYFCISKQDIPANTELLLLCQMNDEEIFENDLNEKRYAYPQDRYCGKHKAVSHTEKAINKSVYQETLSTGIAWLTCKIKNLREEAYQTKNCIKTFQHSKVLKHQEIFKINESLYKPNEADKNILKNKQSEYDEIIHVSDDSYKCDMFNKKFSHISKVKGHKMTLKKGAKSYAFDIESKKISFSFNLKKYLKTDVGKKLYKNDICDKKPSSRLRKHKRSLNTAKKHCSCDKSSKFSNYSVLKRCKRASSEKQLYWCNKCSKKSSSISYLKCGKMIDTEAKSYECDTCNKKFSSNSGLNRHKKIHTGKKLYKCDTCSKKFLLYSHLKSHKIVHTGEKPYTCDQCNKKFSSNSGLRRHKMIHTGEKLYKCDICSKKFLHSSHLKSHMSTHTGEKPYECDICNKKFSHTSGLKKHKRIHTGEKPYECDTCTKKFSSNSDLKSHKRTHTGEKPYECDTCTKKFSSNSDLKRHKRTHIKESSEINMIIS